MFYSAIILLPQRCRLVGSCKGRTRNLVARRVSFVHLASRERRGYNDNGMKHISIVLSMVALSFCLTTRVHAATNGSLIKSSTDSAVYYLVDGKRYAFPNEKVFFSWYNDFGGVVTVSANELASYALSANVTYRPGRWLVKIQTDPKVYAVSQYGVLRWIASEQVASALYGTNWSTKVQDIPDTFFINYKIGASIVSVADYSSEGELAITQIAQNILGATVPAVVNPLVTMEQKTFDLINQHRQSKGLSALVWNDAIANAARGHSADMASGKVALGHDGFAERIDDLRATMTLSAEAENVAYDSGYADPATTAVNGWLASPGHLANIENAAYNHSGMGIAQSSNGSYYFTQLFVQSTPTP